MQEEQKFAVIITEVSACFLNGKLLSMLKKHTIML